MNNQNTQPLDTKTMQDALQEIESQRAEYKKVILDKKKQQQGINLLTIKYSLKSDAVETLITYSDIIIEIIISAKCKITELAPENLHFLDEILSLTNFADLMIYKAIELNNLDLLNFWLKYPNFENFVDCPDTFMPHAFSFGSLEIVDRLLKISDRLNDVKREPEKSLGPALASDKPAVLNRYLEIDEALKCVVENSAQALQIASNMGYPEIVKRAIDNYTKPRRKLSNSMA